MVKRQRPKKSIGARITQRFVSGLLVLIPLGVALFVLSLLFNATVGVVASGVGLLLDEFPRPVVLLLSAMGTVLLIYAAGLLTSFVIGKRLIALGERLVTRIPVVATVYTASKQVIDLFQARTEAQSQKVVLADFPAPGLKALGFLTGRITAPDGSKCLKVFIPTTPNPTTGFLQIIPESGAQVLDLSTEEAFKIIMSGGFLAPDSLQASEADPLSGAGI